jgi:hypothetical protein
MLLILSWLRLGGLLRAFPCDEKSSVPGPVD